MRKPLVLALAAASLGGIALAGPAGAACTTTDCTNVSVTVLDGTLSIVATSAASGTSGVVSSSAGALADVSLGVTTVTDTRTSSTGWVSKASASAFSLTGGTATIASSAANFYVPVAPVASLGTVTFSYPQTSAAAVASGAALVTATSTAGPSTATFTPFLKLTIPAAQAAGVYTGTVTQSVA